MQKTGAVRDINWIVSRILNLIFQRTIQRNKA